MSLYEKESNINELAKKNHKASLNAFLKQAQIGTCRRYLIIIVIIIIFTFENFWRMGEAQDG